MLKNRPREFKQEGRTRGASQWQGTCLASVKSEFHARTTRNKFIRLVGLLSSVHKALVLSALQKPGSVVQPEDRKLKVILVYKANLGCMRPRLKQQ